MKKTVLSFVLIFGVFLTGINLVSANICEYKEISGGYEDIDDLEFSQDGKNIIFSIEKNNKEYIVENLILNSKSYDRIDELVYSPNGKEFSFTERQNNGRYFIVTNFNKSKDYYNIIDELTYSLDGSKFGFIANKNGKNIVVINGLEIDKYDDVSNLKKTRDGKGLSFIAESKGKFFYVFKGIESDKFDTKDDLIFDTLRKNKFLTINTISDDYVYKYKDNNKTEISNLNYLNYETEKYKYLWNGNTIFRGLKDNKVFLIQEICPGESSSDIFLTDNFHSVKSFKNKNVNIEIKKPKQIQTQSQSTQKIKKPKTRNQALKEIILSKNKLRKTSKGRKLVVKIDKLGKQVLPKLSNDKLGNLYKKINSIDLSNNKYRKYKDLLGYMKLRVELEMANRIENK